MKEPRWLKDSVAQAIHRRQLAEHGGLDGVRDAGMLESALARAKNLFDYGNPKPDVAAMAAAYAFGIVKNHPFVDGNKRTAYVLCRTFLKLNGTDIDTTEADKYLTFISVADGSLSEDGLTEWIREHLVKIKTKKLTQWHKMDISSWQIDPVWIYYPSAVLLLVLCIGAWLLTLLTLPGNWIVLAMAAGFTWLFPAAAGRGMHWPTIAVLAVIAIIGELIEFGAGAAGAAKQGASRRAVGLSIVGAAVGSILGLMVGTPVPVIGSFVMAVLGGAMGAFAGAYVGESWKGRSEDERVAAGKGAFVGRLWGTAGKLSAGAIMLAIVAWDAFL